MIWCVEDDPAIRDIEIYALQSAGFSARGFENGTAFLEALRTQKPRLVLLDVMLPGPDGISILNTLRTTQDYGHIPVIMATAKGSEYDKITGLDSGADDYLVKPFSMMEMISRVKAVLRRAPIPPTFERYTTGPLSLDMKSRTVLVKGQRIPLTLKEFELLRVLIAHCGTALERERLYALVWGSNFIGESRTVDMHIRTLRQKLGPCGELIQTVRGVGYLLEAAHEE